MSEPAYTNRRYILDYLAENPDREFTANEVAEALGIPTGTAGGRLSVAHQQGSVLRRRAGRSFLYRHGQRPVVSEVTVVHYPPDVDPYAQIAEAWTVAFGHPWSPELVAVALRLAERITNAE